MIRTFSSIILGLLLTINSIAQDYKKDWAEGKLTWSDFSEKTTSQGVSELKYFLGYNSDKQKFGDTTVVRTVATC